RIFHRDRHLICLVLNAFDARVNLLGGVVAILGEVANLARDDGEPTAVLARIGRLDSRVERQQVGLAGKLRDELDDITDFLAALPEALDAPGGLQSNLAYRAHALARALCRFATIVRDAVGLLSDGAG